MNGSTAALTDRDRLRSMLEATADGMWEWDVPTGEVLFSPTCFTMLGYEPDGWPHACQTWSRLLHPDDRPRAETAVREHLEGKRERIELEFRLRCKDGRWKWILGRGKVIRRDEAGRPVRLIGTHQDIHSRKQREEETLFRTSFLETLLDTIPSPVFYKDREGVYRGCNQSFADQILGMPRERIVGATVYDLPEAIPAELADIYHSKDLELIHAPGHQVYEARVQCATGVEKEYLFSKATFLDHDGQAAGIVGVMLDVSERKRAEREMMDSRERLEHLLHALPVGIVLIEKSTLKIVEANPAAVMMIGSTPEQLAGNVCHRFICPAERGNCPIVDLGMEVNNSQRELITSDGESIPILKTVLPLTLDGRDYLLECFKDIRHLKEAEAERIEKEKLQAMMETAGSVCHEMNQPLQILSSFSELLLMDCKEDGKEASTLKAINDQVHRMGGITRKLENLTRFQTKAYLDGRIVDIDMSSRPAGAAASHGNGPRPRRRDPVSDSDRPEE